MDSQESRARVTQRIPGSARVIGRPDAGRSDTVEISRLFRDWMLLFMPVETAAGSAAIQPENS